jgi:hypothetical protein
MEDEKLTQINSKNKARFIEKIQKKQDNKEIKY